MADDKIERIKGKIAKDASIEAALMAAYQEANIPLTSTFQGMAVSDKIATASNRIEIGDIIIQINSQPFNDEAAFLRFTKQCGKSQSR